MEDVLYDYHLAQAMSASPTASKTTGRDDAAYNENYYIQAALRKYGISQKDFDRSLEWYYGHSEELFAIYKRLNDRVAAQLGNEGSSIYMADGASHDTLDIWQGPRGYLLSSAGTNVYSFEQKVDTAVQAGDRLVLTFFNDWFYREGSKEGIVQLALVYEGDSTQVQTTHFYTSGHHELIARVSNRPLRAIRGFFYQSAEWSDRPKLIVLSNIALVRMRDRQQQVPDPTLPVDSLAPRPASGIRTEQSLRDSLLRADTLQQTRPHFK